MSEPHEPDDNSLKDQGNREFTSGNWLKAAALYTKAIKEEPNNSVLYRYAVPRPEQNKFTMSVPSNQLRSVSGWNSLLQVKHL